MHPCIKNPMDTPKKRAIAFAALLAVALILTAAFSLDLIGGPDGDEDDGEIPEDIISKYLRFDGENYQVTVSRENTCETTVVVNPNDPDNVVAGANDYTTPSGDSWCGAYWSRDGGKTWDQTLIPGYRGGPPSVLTGYGIAGDPVVVFDSDGNCYMAGLAARRKQVSPFRPFQKMSCIWVARSTDGGETWGQVRTVATSITAVNFHDKEWITADPSDGTIYVTWTVFNFLAASEIVCARSDDGGLTWNDYRVISEITGGETQTQGSYPVVDDDGVLHVVWIGYGPDKIRYSRSSDRGQTFSTPIDVSPLTPLPYQMPPHTYRTPTMPAMAVDRSDTNSSGSLYITWPDSTGGDGDIMLSHSRDGGDSWSEPVRVNNDTAGNGAHQFFPSVSVSPQGYVCLIFYDMRDDPDRILLNIYFAMSVDGGETFPINFNVTNVMFDGENSAGSLLGQLTASEHTAFIGDYIQLDTNEYGAYCSWCDCRNGSPSEYNSDVYFAYVDFVDVNELNATGEG